MIGSTEIKDFTDTKQTYWTTFGRGVGVDLVASAGQDPDCLPSTDLLHVDLSESFAFWALLGPSRSLAQTEHRDDDEQSH